jgi:hypothetical protein
MVSKFAFKFNLHLYNSAQGCEAWHRACNPDENPIECWHWCHWDALQRTPAMTRIGGGGGGGGAAGGGGTGTSAVGAAGAWSGLDSINHLLSHVQLSPRLGTVPGTVNQPPGDEDPPPLHRMCLRSCHSVLARRGCTS